MSQQLYLDMANEMACDRAKSAAARRPAAASSAPRQITPDQIVARYESAVEREMKQGRDRRTALAVVQRRQPALHLAWCQVRTANRGA